MIIYLYVFLHEAHMLAFMLYVCYLVCWEILHDDLLSLCFIA